MIRPTTYCVDKNILANIAKISQPGKLTLNEPTGDFFYNPWKLKKQFAGTAVDTALLALPGPIGEARLITLESGRCYFSHSDIDDRYHLNITGDCAFLVDIETRQNYFLEQDAVWHEMDAGIIHSAVNYGQHDRIQLVVRKLLIDSQLGDYVIVRILPDGPNARYVFDNTISPWLNRANKKQWINKFAIDNNDVVFNLSTLHIDELVGIMPLHFNYTIL